MNANPQTGYRLPPFSVATSGVYQLHPTKSEKPQSKFEIELRDFRHDLAWVAESIAKLLAWIVQLIKTVLGMNKVKATVEPEVDQDGNAKIVVKSEADPKLLTKVSYDIGAALDPKKTAAMNIPQQEKAVQALNGEYKKLVDLMNSLEEAWEGADFHRRFGPISTGAAAADALGLPEATEFAKVNESIKDVQIKAISLLKSDLTLEQHFSPELLAAIQQINKHLESEIEVKTDESRNLNSSPIEAKNDSINHSAMSQSAISNKIVGGVDVKAVGTDELAKALLPQSSGRTGGVVVPLVLPVSHPDSQFYNRTLPPTGLVSRFARFKPTEKDLEEDRPDWNDGERETGSKEQVQRT